jgi:SnoaL-like domain
MESYFNAMGADEDFAEFYTTDVRLIMPESGREVHGRRAVRDYLIAIHAKMFDHQRREFVLADGYAYLEGDCVDRPGGTGLRFAYCLVYDLDGDRIQEMRSYGSTPRLMTEAETARFLTS